uniref:Uncharacterized protein n=1 Tax=Chromera velia CCMP2878 TaxID=1169474 RepID=A0A0G4GAG6_9ALVE|eukprot:Cvel_20920.t1-p1 / transcript=Cvel_20920.t1 / gene=Cvel_20920 / organism=Chromera_velia_CCMP2878 / gene_product=hypothetical protein / transcript_product=hypothetical protein / location=Cvel_scaffold1919:34065-34742(-) / protein_length=226 / sequence_SO=supercontig / SO=protein_coding / is_pseudo=false
MLLPQLQKLKEAVAEKKEKESEAAAAAAADGDDEVGSSNNELLEVLGQGVYEPAPYDDTQQQSLPKNLFKRPLGSAPNGEERNPKRQAALTGSQPGQLPGWVKGMSKANACRVFQTLCADDEDFEETEEEDAPIPLDDDLLHPPKLNEAIAAEATKLRAIMPSLFVTAPAVGAILTKPSARNGACHPDLLALKASELPNPFEEDIIEYQAKRFIEDGNPQKIAERH